MCCEPSLCWKEKRGRGAGNGATLDDCSKQGRREGIVIGNRQCLLLSLATFWAKLRNEISLVNYSCVMNSVLLPFEWYWAAASFGSSIKHLFVLQLVTETVHVLFLFINKPSQAYNNSGAFWNNSSKMSWIWIIFIQLIICVLFWNYYGS